MYFDINSLYGAAMSSYLSYGSLEWVDSVDTHLNDILNLSENSHVGYILEVDLKYPENLFEYHKDFPLCPEKLITPTANNSKLVTTFYSKQNYVVYYRNLQLYVKLGIIVKNVHRVLKFAQSAWMKPYIDLNMKLRASAKNDFEKNLYKLIVNSVYGKTIQNVRKYKEVKLVTKWEGRYGANSLIASPRFHSSTIFDKEGVVIIEMQKEKVKFDKPIYIGFCVLDISKTFVYDFHYNYIKNELGPKAKLLYTDTDSLIYDFNVDIYEIMKRDIHRYDTSDYPENNIFAMPRVNKKKVGVMKDELAGSLMLEYVGLKSKMYCYRTAERAARRVREAIYDRGGQAIKL